MSDIENSHQRALKAAEDQTQLYAEYWRGSLGSYLRGSPKERTHEACAQWLSDCTMNAVHDAASARYIIVAVKKWRDNAVTARTLGVPEPSILDLLPALIASAALEELSA